MKELGRSTQNDTYTITSFIRTLKYVSDILQTEEAFTVEEYKHTHTNTHTHTHTHTRTHARTHAPTHKLQDLFLRTTLITILYKSFVRTHLDYGDVIYDQAFYCSRHKKLESVQYNPCLTLNGEI